MDRTGKPGTRHLALDELVSQLRQVLGAELDAIVLYGSAASGEQIAGRSDINVMVIAGSYAIDTLRTLGQTMRAWQEAGNPAVLMLTRAEWQGSADVFPMEYADILERHQVLHGVLPLDGIGVQASDLRLQVEQEAMGKMLRLRRGVMVASTDTERQQELLRASLSSLLVIFRAVLRLHGQVPSRDADDVIAAVAHLVGFSPDPFRSALALRKGTAIPATETASVLEGYVHGMAALVAYLDRFALPATPDR